MGTYLWACHMTVPASLNGLRKFPGFRCADPCYLSTKSSPEITLPKIEMHFPPLRLCTAPFLPWDAALPSCASVKPIVDLARRD